MRGVRIRGALILACAAALCACGGKSSSQGHTTHAEAAVTAPPLPTPDTTPIAVLRTPAGLALKPETAPVVTATPAPGPTPVGTPAGSAP